MIDCSCRQRRDGFHIATVQALVDTDYCADHASNCVPRSLGESQGDLFPQRPEKKLGYVTNLIILGNMKRIPYG